MEQVKELMIKNDLGLNWVCAKIQDFAEVVTGGTPSTTIKEYWDNGNIAWLNSGELNQDVIIECENFITSKGLENSSARLMPKDTVLIALTGATTGVVGYLTFEACANQSVTGILPSNKHHPKFLYYYLKSIRNKVLADSYGGAQKHISQGYVKELQVPLPPLPIQKRIAEILDAADALKRKDQELLKKYDALAQAIFIDMFGDPVKNEKGWVTYSIEEVTSFIDYRGKTPERSEKNEVPLITAKNVKFGYYDFSEKDYVSLDKYNEIMTRGFPKVGDVLFTTEGATLGNVCRIPDLPKFAIGQRLISMSGDKVTTEYLHYILCSDFFQDQVYKYATGSAVKGIRSAVLKKLIIPVPKYDVQLKFTSAIQAIEKQIKNATRSFENSSNIFSTLLQKAFNGEL